LTRHRKAPQNKKALPWRAVTVIITIGVIANLIIWFRPQQEPELTYQTYPAELIAQGEEIYRVNCAACHGPAGQGNPDNLIPALNGTMHAWHHGDGQIAGFLRQGVGRMPAIGAGWSDSEITAVLAYVKQWWQPDQRAFQARVTNNER